MTCAIQASGTIEQYFYGELPPDRRAEIQSHLWGCHACRRALEDLTIIRAALATRPDVSTPADGDWSAFMARLDTAVRAAPEPESGEVASPVVAVPSGLNLVPYLALAALLALATLTAVFLLRPRTEGDLTPARTIQADESLQAPASADPALVSLSDQHFNRSKLVVLGLATRDASRPGDGNWDHERELAATLLGDTRLYRRAAEERGMNTLAGVMRDLELVLLQTSMSDEPDAESLDRLQRLIRRRDLLTKMNTAYVAQP